MASNPSDSTAQAHESACTPEAAAAATSGQSGDLAPPASPLAALTDLVEVLPGDDAAAVRPDQEAGSAEATEATEATEAAAPDGSPSGSEPGGLDRVRQRADDAWQKRQQEIARDFQQLCAEVETSIAAGDIGRTTTDADVDALIAVVPPADGAALVPDVDMARQFLGLVNRQPAMTRIRGHRAKGYDGTPPAGAVKATKAVLTGRGATDLAKWPSWHLRTYFITGMAKPMPVELTDWKDQQGWGHEDGHIGAMTAFFCEHDSLTKAQQAAIDWQGLGLPVPTVCVWSGGKSAHWYWTLSEPITDLWRWRWMTWRLIQITGSDGVIENWSRLMRLPGCFNIDAQGAITSRAVIDPTLCCGLPVTLAAFEHALVVAEAKRGVDPLDSIPASKMTDQAARAGIAAVLQAHHPHLVERFQTQTRIGASVGRTTQFISQKAKDNLAKVNLRQLIHLVLKGVEAGKIGEDQMRAAISHVPRRPGADSGTYDLYRKLLWSAQENAKKAGVDDPVQFGIDLLEEHSPSAECGWDVDGTGRYVHTNIQASSFWWVCAEHGWEPEGGWDQLLTDSTGALEQALEQIDVREAEAEITALIEAGASDSAIQSAINQFAQQGAPGHGLQQFAALKRQDLERLRDLTEAAAVVAARTRETTVEIDIADFLPPELISAMRIVRHGMKIPDLAIVLVVVCSVTSLLPPSSRIFGKSAKQVLVAWLMLLGESGTAKTAAMKALLLEPFQAHVAPWLREENARRQKDWLDAQKGDEKIGGGPKTKPPRKVSLMVTGGTTQGLEADMTHWGHVYPVLNWREELEGWLATMQTAKDGEAGLARSFWNASYDQSFQNVSLAEESRSRMITEGKLSLIGGGQPDVIQAAIDGLSQASGFWARPLMTVIPDTTARVLLEDQGEQQRLNHLLGGLFLELVTGKHDYRGCSAQVPQFHLTQPAEELFGRFWDDCEATRTGGATSAVKGVVAKMAFSALRLAPAIQVLRDHFGQTDRQKANYWEDHSRLERLTEDDIATLQKVGSRCCGGPVWVQSETLALAIQLTKAAKGVSLAINEESEDEAVADQRRFLRAAQKLLQTESAQADGAPLYRIGKTGWRGNRDCPRPNVAALEAMAQTLAAQGQITWSVDQKKVHTVKKGAVIS